MPVVEGSEHCPAYNPEMTVGNVTRSFLPPGLAAMGVHRLTLLLNHVLSSESQAMARLRAHAGREVEIKLQDWVGVAPTPPLLRFCITPAGLLEWVGEEAEASQRPADLVLSVAASQPVQLLFACLAGRHPPVEVTGDAEFAADVNWLVDNLRWDVRDDLMAWVGPVRAEQAGRVLAGVAGGLKSVLGRFAAAGSGPPTPGPR